MRACACACCVCMMRACACACCVCMMRVRADPDDKTSLKTSDATLIDAYCWDLSLSVHNQVTDSGSTRFASTLGPRSHAVEVVFTPVSSCQQFIQFASQACASHRGLCCLRLSPWVRARRLRRRPRSRTERCCCSGCTPTYLGQRSSASHNLRLRLAQVEARGKACQALKRRPR